MYDDVLEWLMTSSDTWVWRRPHMKIEWEISLMEPCQLTEMIAIEHICFAFTRSSHIGLEAVWLRPSMCMPRPASSCFHTSWTVHANYVLMSANYQFEFQPARPYHAIHHSPCTNDLCIGIAAEALSLYSTSECMRSLSWNSNRTGEKHHAQYGLCVAMFVLGE